MPVENTFNFEDQILLPLVFNVLLLLGVLYVVYRVIVLFALRHHFKRERGGFFFKVVISSFPASFAILLMIRSINHYLNNLCVVWIPIAYFIRNCIYASTGAYLSIALIPLLTRQMQLQPTRMSRAKRVLIPLVIFVALVAPGLIFVAVMAVGRLGVAMNGVCTLTSSASVLGVSAAVWLETGIESVVLGINLIAAIRLHWSTLPGRFRAEVRALLFWGSALLFWDILTRFGIWTLLSRLLLPASFVGPVRGLLMLTFPSVYVVGMSVFVAHSLELRVAIAARILPVDPRLYIAALGIAGLSNRQSARIHQVYVKDRASRFKRPLLQRMFKFTQSRSPARGENMMSMRGLGETTDGSVHENEV